MTNYTMPVLSEQEREDLKKFILLPKDESVPNYPIEEIKKYVMLSMEIALAALMAKPVGCGFREDIHLMKNRRMVNGSMTLKYHGEEALFTAPAVPVKKESEGGGADEI